MTRSTRTQRGAMPLPSPWLILVFLLLQGNPVDVAKLPGDLNEEDELGNNFNKGSNNQDGDPEGALSSNEEAQGLSNYTAYEEWMDDYPTCNGMRQSPVDVENEKVETKILDVHGLRGSGYKVQPISMTITNNGHSVMLSGKWPKNKTPTIWGGPLPGVYMFTQMHFHWGADDSYGSEHTFDQESFPLEVHVVHFKTAYGNMSNALEYDDGVLVIATLLAIGEHQNVALDKIQANFQDILTPGQSKTLEPFALKYFIGGIFNGSYVSYLGSLTTPPCSEAVIWFLSLRIRSVSTEQMEAFRQIKLNNDFKYNNRNTQPLNGRQIMHYHYTSE
ncbi:PREDICTED: carbonic anhydrase 2-like [Ceratosolen solmsi marchali]|uniref:Carbonic anhydrase 2-like n=1 Tax=Ceratosolen solmsi marchali TaxID=326594 RepID=A0AAJ7E0D0_9HYME|nr:PREDICTED: carbonic anhydrase 2-like [Ceratosolen solmsi marchali]